MWFGEKSHTIIRLFVTESDPELECNNTKWHCIVLRMEEDYEKNLRIERVPTGNVYKIETERKNRVNIAKLIWTVQTK